MSQAAASPSQNDTTTNDIRVDAELEKIIVKISCDAFNYGVYCESKQIFDSDEKLTKIENLAHTQILTLFNQRIVSELDNLGLYHIAHPDDSIIDYIAYRRQELLSGR